jgi:Resolvase, N terminal domain
MSTSPFHSLTVLNAGRALRDSCAAGRRGRQIVEEFTDQGVSGCKESRPALNRLMSDACRRRFDAVLVRSEFCRHDDHGNDHHPV